MNAKRLYTAISTSLLMPSAVLAQVDTNSGAYQSGKSVGYLFGALIVIWVLKKIFSK